MFRSQTDTKLAINLAEGWKAVEPTLKALPDVDRRRMNAVRVEIEHLWQPIHEITRMRVALAREELRATLLKTGRGPGTVRNMICSFNKIVASSPEVPAHQDAVDAWSSDREWQTGLPQPLVNEWLKFVDTNGIRPGDKLSFDDLTPFKEMLLAAGLDPYSTVPRKMTMICQALRIEKPKKDESSEALDSFLAKLLAAAMTVGSDPNERISLRPDPFLLVAESDALTRQARVLKMFIEMNGIDASLDFPQNVHSALTNQDELDRFVEARAKEGIAEETVYTNLHDLKGAFKIARLAGIDGFKSATADEFETFRINIEKTIKQIAKVQKSKRKIFKTDARKEFHEECPDLMIVYPRIMKNRGEYLQTIMAREEKILKGGMSRETRTSLYSQQAEDLRAACFLDIALSGGNRAEDIMELHEAELELFQGLYFCRLMPNKTDKTTEFHQQFFLPPWLNSAMDLYLSKYREVLNGKSKFIFPPIGKSEESRKVNQHEYFNRWTKRIWGEAFSNYHIRNGLIVFSSETGSIYPINIKLGHSPDWMSEKALKGLTKLQARRYFRPSKESLYRMAIDEYKNWAGRLEIPFKL